MKTSKIIEAIMLLFKRKPKPNPKYVLFPYLLAFLKERDIFDRFWANYLKGEEFRKRLKVNGFTDSIMYAFNWEDTPEGVEFWFNYCRIFEKLKDSR